MVRRRKKLELHLRQTVDDFPGVVLGYWASLERAEGLGHTGEVFQYFGPLWGGFLHLDNLSLQLSPQA